MKYYNKIAAIAFVLLFTVGLFAQTRDMSTDEWEQEMARLGKQKVELTAEQTALKAEIEALKVKKSALGALSDCENETLKLIGATQADVDAFAAKVAALEAKINAKEGPKADRQAELDALKASKISALPRFFDKVHNQLQRKLDAWDDKPSEIQYTVVKGDYLWKIAKKKEHYGNGFAWPKIYNANKDKIKNPDLIYPNQIFTVPNLSEEEQAKYDKLRRNYKPAPVTTAP
ncbi:MAG: LysM peptidoglycan-binding domain-containing protein [Ignavibacteria bacterium]|nr:LysM peptidoglycan-binding domain-containing protein [Ignavibacteria bacterium]